MLSIVTGPFHPDLETALVSQIRSLKQSNPLAPVAIIAPSQQLARRVKWLLAVEQGIALLDVHVLTFHQLAMTLIDEQGGNDRPTLVNVPFREELLRYLVDRGIPGAESFQGLRRMKGLWAVLWATIQDLKEARVDAGEVLSALAEGRLIAEGSPRLAALLQLQASVLEVDKALRLADPDDLAALAAERASGSAFLKRMERVCYYGFYDLTQGQLDLFRAISSTHPTTVFFPLRAGSPAYLFAGKFFAAHIQGLSGPIEGAGLSGVHDGAAGLADEMLPSVRGTCRIVSTVGPEDEVSTAAKEILHLIEDHGFEPTDIGLVARTLDPYSSILRRVFEENRIPFACSVGTALIEEPLVKTIVKFLRLHLESFPRADVIDVLSTPALRFDNIIVGGDIAQTVLRPDLWDWATRRLGIVRADAHDGGLGEWRRLEGAVKRGLDSARDNAEPPGHPIPVAQLAVLFQLVERLHEDLSALPISGGWSDYTDAFLRLLPAYFNLPGWSHREPATAAERVEVAVRDCLNSVKALDQLDEHISLPDWVAHVVRVLERSRVPSGENDLPGVRCMDAMDARGLTFRAVFVLGLNEKVFPRSVHEDAFLGDEEREVLSRDLGYKIARKLEGFDEERLLFALVLRSARERLYLSYQRADRNGRPMVPSGYLAEVMAGVSEPVWLIKRRPMERWSERPFAQGPSDWTVLTPREASLQLILGGGSAGVDRLLRLYQSQEWFAEGMQAVAHIDSLKPLLTPYDGLVGTGRPHWGAVERWGVSPSALEHYAQCPFRYFAVHLLRLDQMEAPETVFGLDARARGLLCHDILKEFYEGFHRRGVSPVDASQAEVDLRLADAAAEAFARYEATEPVGYPLLWTLTKEGLLRLTRAFLHDDLGELRESGYIPTFFELPVQGEFGTVLPVDLRHVPIRGRMDRVDVRRDEGLSHVRVVDYKYTESKSSKKEDRDLVTAAVRGMKLQPPLYLLAAAGVLEGQQTVVDAAALYFLAPRWEDGPVVRTQVTVPCGGDSMREILDGVRSGRFFILPDDYCDRCEFASMCRRSHHPTRWRRRDDAHKVRLLALRKQTGNENRDGD